MTETALHGRRVLIVEDEYMLASDLSDALQAAGAQVIGPIPSVGEAAALIADGTTIDLAVLDVNLRGEMIFPVADALAAHAIPFAFATGYDRWTLPKRFADTPWIDKPFAPARLAALLAPLMRD